MERKIPINADQESKPEEKNTAQAENQSESVVENDTIQNEEIVAENDNKENSEEETPDYRALVKKMSDQELAKLFDKARNTEYYLETLQRNQAENENYRKRAEREQMSARRYANQDILKNLIVILDHLQLAINSGKDANIDPSFFEGITLLEKEFQKLLNDSEVKIIEAIGKTFDPKFHEALSQQETADEPNMTVLYEMEKGYTFHDRVIRPSKVVVSRYPQEPAKPAEKETPEKESGNAE